MKLVYIASLLGGRFDPPKIVEIENETNNRLRKSIKDYMQGNKQSSHTDSSSPLISHWYSYWVKVYRLTANPRTGLQQMRTA